MIADRQSDPGRLAQAMAPSMAWALDRIYASAAKSEPASATAHRIAHEHAEADAQLARVKAVVDDLLVEVGAIRVHHGTNGKCVQCETCKAKAELSAELIHADGCYFADLPARIVGAL